MRHWPAWIPRRAPFFACLAGAGAAGNRTLGAQLHLLYLAPLSHTQPAVEVHTSLSPSGVHQAERLAFENGAGSAPQYAARAAAKCHLPCLRLGSPRGAQVDQLAGEILRRVLPEGVKL